MITKTERDNAFDKVDHIFIEILRGWLVNEKSNLDSFIENPEEHIDYDPYIVPNFDALRQRSEQLGEIAEGLALISSYKQGTGATRSQHDYALDRLPSIISGRLLQWLKDRYKKISKYRAVLPLGDYNTLSTFNAERYEQDVDLYRTSIEGLEIVHQYTIEREQVEDKPEEPIEEEPIVPPENEEEE